MKLTIKQAAAYLNLSAIKEETPQGFVWMIELAEVREADHPADHVGYAATTQLPDQRLIMELEDQVSWLRRELKDRRREHDQDREDWRREIERLHTLMAQQGQTLQALSATVRESASKDHQVSGAGPPPDTASSAGFLKRLRRWLRFQHDISLVFQRTPP